MCAEGQWAPNVRSDAACLICFMFSKVSIYLSTPIDPSANLPVFFFIYSLWDLSVCFLRYLERKTYYDSLSVIYNYLIIHQGRHTRQYHWLRMALSCSPSLSPVDGLHHSSPATLTSLFMHFIPTTEGKCVYQILHVTHSFIRMNINHSHICSRKWNMTAWCWTQITCATKTGLGYYMDLEVTSQVVMPVMKSGTPCISH